MIYFALVLAFMSGFILGLLTLSRIARKSAGKMKLCSSCEYYKECNCDVDFEKIQQFQEDCKEVLKSLNYSGSERL